MSKTVTFENNPRAGEFKALVDGVDSKFRIVNGSRGLSGRDTRNIYLVVRPNGSHIVVGPLASAKKMLTYTLGKEGK